MLVLTDLNGDPIAYDKYSRILGALDSTHLRIHKGIHFQADDYVTAVGTKDYLFTTPAGNPIHLVWDLASTGEALLTVYRNPNAATGATKVASINNNHNSSNVTEVDISSNPVVTAAGADIVRRQLVGSGNKQGSVPRSESEMLLLPSTKYLFRIVGTLNPNILMSWLFYQAEV